MSKTEYNWKPVNGYILILPEEIPTTTESGIEIPEQARDDRPSKGEVLAVSKAWQSEKGGLVPCPVEVGQTIAFKRWSNMEIEEGSKEKIIRFEDVIAIRGGKK